MLLFKSRIIPFFKCNYSVFKILKRTFRYERPEPITGCTFAIKHFDDFYKMLFKKNWSSVRLGLFSPQKYVAVINNFGNAETVQKYLQSLGSFNLKSFLEVQKNNLKSDFIENLPKESDKSVEDLLKKKVEDEKEKEMNMLYAKNNTDGVKAWFDDENNKNSNNEYIYDPEVAITSLKFDISQAQIDKSRLIIPNSKVNGAGLYEFLPATKLRGVGEYISESEYYKYYGDKVEMEINFEKELNLNFPEHLLAYCFDRGEVTEFPRPRKCNTGVYEFSLMDGADLLAVLCLDIKDEDAVLNICFKRESIAYCILQTLKTKILVCNENKNLHRFIKEHFSSSLSNMFAMTTIDFDDPSYQDLFDKILIDADCTDDRASISDTEDNYFSSKNFKKRFKLPEKQSLELAKALKIIKPGGTVLYTTTTLSPMQNDGAVHAALQTAMHEYKMEFVIKDLSPALKHTSVLFNIKNNLGLKYGTLVVPFLPTNFGPRYISKIVKKN